MVRGVRPTILVLVLCSIVAMVRPAAALFHIAHIVEVNARAGNDPTEQYVEIEMDFAGQTVTTNSVLSAWDCDGIFLGDLLIVPADVPAGGDGVRWIMATKNPVGGITPDFLIPSAGIPTDCGQVCWGAPGVIPPADPDSWPRTDLNNFVDCVAYGPYTGPTRAGSGAPSPSTPGDGTYALVRLDDRTLAAACPTPENNSGAVGDYGPCTEPTTTTSVVTTSTTTTLPPGGADLMGGHLVLSTKGENPNKSKLGLFSIAGLSDALTLGGGPGSADDPTLHGGRLLVFSSAAGAFVNEYPLDDTTGSWVPKRKRGEQVGYSFKGGGPISRVTIVEGKRLTAKGRGSSLELTLAVDPRPVGVILEIGTHRYCFEFGAGGLVFFKPDKRFRAPKNGQPGTCPTVPD